MEEMEEMEGVGGWGGVEADSLMKVNVERAPCRSSEEWAGPPKQ